MRQHRGAARLYRCRGGRRAAGMHTRKQTRGVLLFGCQSSSPRPTTTSRPNVPPAALLLPTPPPNPTPNVFPTCASMSPMSPPSPQMSITKLRPLLPAPPPPACPRCSLPHATEPPAAPTHTRTPGRPSSCTSAPPPRPPLPLCGYPPGHLGPTCASTPSRTVKMAMLVSTGATAATQGREPSTAPSRRARAWSSRSLRGGGK